MADRRGSRFVAEALFLVALAVALGLARLHAFEIAAAMLAGWVVVAAIEWASWRAEPHFGSGLPPRYYVPAVKLPPSQPLEQVEQGYPDASREEAPTWIASAALRAEVLGEWPLSAPVELETEPVEEEQPEPEAEAEELEPAPEADRWTAVEPPAAPLDDQVSEVSDAFDDAEEPGPVARHTLDPLADPEPKRRFARRTAVVVEMVEVAARPRGRRPLPGVTSRT
ncbi:MAG TPA: hypothetical protein VFI04_04310 [Gaiellaceae bacterium]|jgi:hypothetical protein|nr:hypothetical protein [Gaiellaceae bacterium]